jgi:hypothetical protein
MSSARAIRYRRLALATEEKAIADLLLKLANAIGGFSAPLNGVRRGHSAKMSSRQKQETPRTGLSGTHYMTDVENQFFECRSVAAIAPLASWSVRASFLA